MPKLSRSYTAKKAQAIGDSIEQIADLAFRHYQNLGLVDFTPTYPRAKFTRGKWTVTGKAHPDRLATIAEMGGRTCWIEIKTWLARDRHTYSFTGKPGPGRLAQYLKLTRANDFNALSFYLVCWRWAGNEQWRLHPVNGKNAVIPNYARSYDDHPESIVFIREEGYLIDSSQGWPDWLAAVNRQGER